MLLLLVLSNTFYHFSQLTVIIVKSVLNIILHYFSSRIIFILVWLIQTVLIQNFRQALKVSRVPDKTLIPAADAQLLYCLHSHCTKGNNLVNLHSVSVDARNRSVDISGIPSKQIVHKDIFPPSLFMIGDTVEQDELQSYHFRRYVEFCPWMWVYATGHQGIHFVAFSLK